MPKTKTKATKAKNKPKASRPRSAAGTRKLKGPSYKSFRLHKKIKTTLPPMVGSFRLFGRSIAVLARHYRLFIGILLIYGILNLVLVHGFSANANLSSLKATLDATFSGSSHYLSNGLTLFVYLLGGASSTSSANASAGVYQTLLIILVSLVVIWSLRQVYANTKVRIRDGYYRGLYPLIPFILVLLVIGLELLPLIIGGFLYSTVISNGIAVYAIEKVLWGLLFFLLGLLSLYMVCSSVFALYIVTLPDMTPMKALRSARELVRHRRFLVLRKILFLPLALLVLAAAVMLPAISFITGIAEWLYFVITIVGLAIINSYMYALYRELLPHE